MPYDEQGNFYGSDDLGALEAKYTPTDYASQIPGQVSSSKSDKPQSLRDQAVSALMQYNPLMMRKSLQEASGAIGVGGLLPIVAPISAGVQKLNALPGNLYRKYLGEEEVKTPTAEELMQKYSQPFAPKTPLGQEMTEGAIKAFQASKAEGLLGIHPVVARGVNPNDVRVAAGQVKQLAKELRETPQDFQAAQSGLKRQNLYGEDTIGVKAQSAADSLAETLERRKSDGKSLIPGLPEALTPETSMYAVRPGKSRIVQPVVPKTAGLFRPEFDRINEMLSDVYGDTPANEMPPTMVMTEYSNKFVRDNNEFLNSLTKFEKQKALEMFPDAPSPAAAQRAYDLKFAERSERNKQQLAHIEEFFETPEGSQFREQGIPTPTEFMERMAEGERVLKGPLTNFLAKNIGAEGDPSLKLARQGITFETPERIKELSNYVNPSELARNRLEGGFPAMGTYVDEHYAKNTELDKLNEKIRVIEDIRQPLFDQAHAENRNPAEFPEYAETTQPLRLLLRDREKLQADIENIKLARAYEDLSDYSVTPRTKQEMLKDIPYEQHQFFPSVTKAGENEKLYTVNRSIMNDMGYKKLGEELLSDILTGKAGDTSKLTIENYIRQKHLTRVEAEKAAKVQQQQYRQALEGVLVTRLRDDPNVKTYGNAAVITLTKDTPKDVALRDVSTDTAVLDHCVGQGGTAPNGRKNILSGQQQYYEPIIDPVTGERNKNVRESAASSYVDNLANGSELASIRDVKTGLPAATIQLNTTYNGDGKFDIGYASGAKNGAIDPVYTNAIRDYLNERADQIKSAGNNLAENVGVFDVTDPRDFQKAARAAKLTQDQLDLVKNSVDLPRFITADDLKAASEGVVPKQSTAVAVRDEAPTIQFTERDHQGVVDDYNDALMNAARDALDNSNIENPERVELGINNIATGFFDRHLNDQAGFIQEPVARLLRVERALEDRIASLHNQGSEYHAEVADALDNFLIDVRGIRGNFERRIRMAEERPAAPAPAPTPAVQGDPMPNLSADDLLASHSDRMTPEQRRWLEDFQTLWDSHADGDGAALDALSAGYQEWRHRNRLQPDPIANLFDAITFEPDNTHPANDVALQQRPGDQALTGRDRDLLTTFNELVNEATAEGSFPGGLTNIDLAQLVRENEIGGLEELGQADRSRLIELLERQQPALPAGRDPYELSTRYDVPPGMVRAILTESNGPIDRLLDLQNEAFTGVGRFETLPEEGRNGAVQLIRDLLNERGQQIRNERQAGGREVAVTDAVPRDVMTLSAQDLLQRLEPTQQRRAQEIAQTLFNDNAFDGNTPVSAATNAVRLYAVGPAEGAGPLVREQAARNLEQMYTAAQHDADQIAEALREVFYEDATGPEDAITQIERDIGALRNRGEAFWEDLVGPMAEDIPWNPTVQAQLIENLETVRDQFREQRDNGYAKGGQVKKARTTPLVATRRNPELAEMTYQYGGMVR